MGDWVNPGFMVIENYCTYYMPMPCTLRSCPSHQSEKTNQKSVKIAGPVAARYNRPLEMKDLESVVGIPEENRKTYSRSSSDTAYKNATTIWIYPYQLKFPFARKSRARTQI
jgi:hypothetical protein